MNTKSCDCWKECPLCCYQILRQFNMLTDAYHIQVPSDTITYPGGLHHPEVYQSRFRRSLSPNKLEAFMLMATDYETD